ncbi:MAG: polysaccharide biosynthesis tyrosine autokinase [Herminiimonas sp.]|nr:polysaccharide biosynthesis tyrosine autokinase [Herminiimonas sp.]
MLTLPAPQAVPVPLLLQDDDDLGLRNHLETIYDKRWLLVKIALVAGLLGAIYTYTAKPVYQANMLIHVEEGSQRESKNILGELSTLFDVKTATPSEMELLQSRLVVSRAIDNLQLYVTAQPDYFPIVGKLVADNNKGLSTPGLLGYGGYAWGGEKIDVSLFEVPQPMENLPFQITAMGKGEYRLTNQDQDVQAIGKIGSATKIDTPKGPILLTVSQLEGKPGARFTLKRTSRLNVIEDVQKALVIAEQGKQSGIIGVSLRRPDPKVASSILNEIGNEYIRQNLARKLEESEKSLSFLNTQLPALKVQLEDAEAKYNQFRNSKGTVNLDEEERISLQQAAAAKTRRIELQQKKTELLVRFMPGHPAVDGVDQQMREINDEIKAIAAHIKSMPLLEQEVLRLSRDVKVKTDLYTALSNTAQQLRLITIAKVGNVRLVDPAMTPEKSVAAAPGKVIGIATLVGLLLGMLFVFMRKWLAGGIDDPQRIEKVLGVPVYATIPHSRKQEEYFRRLQKGAPQMPLLAKESSGDMAIESLRGFRTALQHSMPRMRNNILMVTGPTPGMGKTFVSVNLAAVIAMTGKRVLLIDADFRNGQLHQYFGRRREGGLSDFIEGSKALDQIMHRNVVDNLDFISTGRIPLNPSELLLRPSFAELLKTLSNQYDLIMVDASPIMVAADAMIIGAHAGAIYILARAGVTTNEEIQDGVKRMRHAGLSVEGVLFNDMKLRPGNYGYGYKYGKYRDTLYPGLANA